MSASIYYRVVKPPEGHIGVSAPSAFVEAMTRAFGSSPWRLGGAAIPKLEGMAATSSDGARVNPYQTIISLIQQDDGSTCEIEVWPEY